eukprot:CAMPEP_0201475198 /NCGR_PEP_ID=MMETSP0151_2-20130828/642_1 /ASSEMBLY_ACC=CAM_ASM_000257 /TAXON_ID=200890 /ORGANISM="Paramoeba atlantica, Strain 621/1 / CCAP 1560/9" /LENGTH=489 /DNA_ID=CAMNT_0047855223 /DNA_START=95 /DNA_END=1564 /DNA_ORIENTATION=-
MASVRGPVKSVSAVSDRHYVFPKFGSKKVKKEKDFADSVLKSCGINLVGFFYPPPELEIEENKPILKKEEEKEEEEEEEEEELVEEIPKEEELAYDEEIACDEDDCFSDEYYENLCAEYEYEESFSESRYYATYEDYYYEECYCCDPDPLTDFDNHCFDAASEWEGIMFGNKSSYRRKDRDQKIERFDHKRYVSHREAADYSLFTRRPNKYVTTGVVIDLPPPTEKSGRRARPSRFAPPPSRSSYVPPVSSYSSSYRPSSYVASSYVANRRNFDQDLEAAIQASLAPARPARGPRDYTPEEASRLLVAIQSREITPEDYELLLILDEAVSKKTVQKSVVDSLPEFIWVSKEKREDSSDVKTLVVYEGVQVVPEQKEEEGAKEKEEEKAKVEENEKEEEEKEKEEEEKEKVEGQEKEEQPTVAVTEGETAKAKEGDEELLDSCRICLLEFETGNYVCRLPCQHLFHKECISQWLSKSSTVCPLDGLEVVG